MRRRRALLSERPLQTARELVALLSAGISRLRWAERAVVALLLLAAGLPPVARLYVDCLDPKGHSLLDAVGQHCGIVAVAGAFVCMFALMLMEPPKRLSLRSYVAQLRARLSAIEARLDEQKKS